MRKWFVFGIAFVSVQAFAGEVIMSIKAEGLSGKATLINKIQPDGRKYVRLAINLKRDGGGTVSVLQESYYEKDGSPARMLQVTNLPEQQSRQTVSVLFDSVGAKLTAEAGGKEVKDSHAYPDKGTFKALPEFWFVRDKPNPGDIGTYWRFDLPNRRWVEIKFQYHGYRTVKAGSKSVKAHLVTYGDTKAYLDEKGDPWLIKSPAMTMVRE